MLKQKIKKFISPDEEKSLRNIDVPETAFWIDDVAVCFTPKNDELFLDKNQEPLKIKKINKN
jgi:hypothetical protein